MTISNERIEAEVEAEVRSLTAWNECYHKLDELEIRRLANHSARNRLTAEMARVEAENKLLAAAKRLDDWISTNLYIRPGVSGCEELVAFRAAIATVEAARVS